MDYQKLFDQFYIESSDIPDFPSKKVEELCKKLPPYSRDLAGMIYLIPFGENLSDTEIAYAKVLSLLSLSAFIHGDLEKNIAFNDKEAVLYGDYLFALSFSLIPSDISAEEAKEFLTMTYHFSEKRLSHLAEDLSEEDMILFAKEDYGTPLRRTARKSAEKQNTDSGIKKDYEAFAEAIGICWGILCEGYSISPHPYLKEAKDAANKLPMKQKLEPIIHLLKGAAIEHDQNITKTS